MHIVLNYTIRILLLIIFVVLAVYVLTIGMLGGTVMVHGTIRSLAGYEISTLLGNATHSRERLIGFLIGGLPCLLCYYLAAIAVLKKFVAMYPL